MKFPNPIMAQLYQLVPLPQGIFAGMDIVTRAVVGCLYDRMKLSWYNAEGGNDRFYDHITEEYFCVFSHAELAEQIGVSERTIRRSLDLLKRDNLVWWRKATYKGANRYYLHHGITETLCSKQSGQIVKPIRSE